MGEIIMFDSKHYIPIIRWKAAEKESLEQINDDQKKFITPLIEIIMPQPKRPKKEDPRKTPDELLEESITKLKTTIPNIANDILKYWGKNPAFLDFGLIDISLKVGGLTQVLSQAKELGLFLIPVIGLSSNPELQKTAVVMAKKNNTGLCLRLFRSDLEKTNLEETIEEFIKSNELTMENTDLLIDFQIVENDCLKIASIIDKIPEIIRWRTFTVASGAFPKDLSQFSVDLHKIDRTDWNCWFDQNNSDLIRKPSFGDYTIQHPVYSEPPLNSNPSASIRYTLKTEFMIMRGQALVGEKSKGHAQYPANAQLLIQQDEFFGKDFSFGDAYIADKGKDIHTTKTGTPRTWLRAGINHHIVCVISQISNLS